MHISIILWLLTTSALVIAAFGLGFCVCLASIQTACLTTRSVKRSFFRTTEVINTSVGVAVWGRLINANFDFRSSSVLEFEKLLSTLSKFISMKSGHSLLSWIFTGARKLLGPPSESIE
jgi:hypothetical protein